MNIIAGERRGTKLFAPEGMQTRPTGAKVKESLFNIIQGEIPRAVVLDLFAGSGSLSLEALSRGADRALLCDCSRAAAGVIARNIEKLRYEDKARFLQGDWKSILLGLRPAEADFSLVFLDPPYRMEIFPECAAILHKGKLLADEALLIYEHRAELRPQAEGPFEELRLKQYGDTEIHFYRYHKEASL